MEMIKDRNEPEGAMNLIVFVYSGADAETAELLAKRLNVPLTYEKSDIQSDGLVLRFNADGLTLVGDGQELRADFTRMLPRLRQNNLQGELLVKAAKIKGADHELTAIDATAGFGEDSLLLAAAGFSVRLYEYNPVIAALLRDALRRASEMPELADTVGRMQLFEEDSVTALYGLSSPPDVILLDPMFPARQKSALVKKKFQLIHQLEQPCTDEEKMVRAAIEVRPHKIVIKRPPKGPYLAGIKPAFSLTGKAVRFDCIVLV